VGGEAGPDHQHPVVPQRSEPFAEKQQPLRVQGRQGNLQHRYVCAGIHDGQRHVRAMVEPAVRIVRDGFAVGHQRLDLRG
jgi:hypothetical protein